MKKILVVDDVRAIRNLVIATLKQENYEMFQADSGRQAIEIAQKERPDLIIMDIMMSDIDGFEATKTIKRNPKTKDCFVLMLTAKKHDEDRRRGKEVGADEYFVKPFSPVELINKVNQVLSDS